MKKFLLALDPSSHSRRAAEVLAEVVAQLCGAQVLLVTVIGSWPAAIEPPEAGQALPPGGEVHGDEDAQAEFAQAQAFLQEISRLLAASGIAQERQRLFLLPQQRGVARDLLELAASEECDTIVVGRRNLSRVQSLLLGSVSAAIVQNASGRSVWVIE
jgi:nucleotide-binding universal stress UspA family protein